VLEGLLSAVVSVIFQKSAVIDVIRLLCYICICRGPSSPEFPEISKLFWNCPEF